MIWGNGEKFVGTWLNNLRQGRGIFSYSENDELKRLNYDGEWKKGKRSGKGTLTWKSGKRYIGEWLNDWKHGHRFLTYPKIKIWKR